MDILYYEILGNRIASTLDHLVVGKKGLIGQVFNNYDYNHKYQQVGLSWT